MLASLWADLRARVLALLLPPCVTAECLLRVLLPPCVTAECLLSVLLPPCVTAECLLRICLTVPRVCQPVCLSVILSTYHLCVCVSACLYDRLFDSVYVVGDGAREALCGVIGSRGSPTARAGGRAGGGSCSARDSGGGGGQGRASVRCSIGPSYIAAYTCNRYGNEADV